MFTLHPRLAADTFAVVTLPLCEVRLMNDRRFTWLILVPQREEITELHQLSSADQIKLLQESSDISHALAETGAIDKLNVAALGNLVAQFHWHLVARSKEDPCWPGPVWGCGNAEPYGAETA
ncbi:MAG: HIT domain-containing protein [Candidatus Sedimenticola sp. (ex Thyasira tokunagai)]